MAVNWAFVRAMGVAGLPVLFPMTVLAARLAIFAKVTLPAPIVNSGNGVPTVFMAYVKSPPTSPQINLMFGLVVPV